MILTILFPSNTYLLVSKEIDNDSYLHLTNETRALLMCKTSKNFKTFLE